MPSCFTVLQEDASGVYMKESHSVSSVCPQLYMERVALSSAPLWVNAPPPSHMHNTAQLPLMFYPAAPRVCGGKCGLG